MKEAFWGTLIVILGIFGIVVVNIFQNVTVDNDRVYYLIKESTEAAAYDALDLTNYRLNGTLKIVEDKFVENLTRRFAENVTIGDYTIIVQDVSDIPPMVSLMVTSGITSLKGDKFNIANRVDGIIETKYNLDDVLNFLGITKEEWEKEANIEVEDGKNVCNASDVDDPVCLSGDIMFTGFADATVENAVCQDETPKSNVERVAKYKVCNCGVWEERSDVVKANPVKQGNEWVYTWLFNKTGEVRTINESIKTRVGVNVCTLGIQEMAPNNVQNKKPSSSTYEPSTDNSQYYLCPPQGIRVVKGLKFRIHPNYIPSNSINRNLTWSVTDSNILGIQSSNPAATCILNSEGSNCFSKATITAKEVGTAYVNVSTTRNQTATCKVDVVSGYVDSVDCNDITLRYDGRGRMTSRYSPSYAIYTDFKWSINNSSIATINENTGEVTAKREGNATVTITAPGGKTGTCNLTVLPKEYPDSVRCNDLKIAFNSTGQMRYSVSPSNVQNRTVTWEIMQPNVATIDKNTGVVTAKKDGEATIVVTTANGIRGMCKLTVEQQEYPDSVSCDDLEIKYGATGEMKHRVSPTRVQNKTVTWKISDSNIATIDKNTGKVTAKKDGEATITVTTENNKTGTCKLTVKPKENVDSVSCEDLELKVGTEGVMKRSYKPENATNTKFAWTINDDSVATINKDSGVVATKKAGTATVTITAPGGKTGTCNLTVTAPQSTAPDAPSGGEGCSVSYDETTDSYFGVKKGIYACLKKCGCMVEDPINPGKCQVARSCNHPHETIIYTHEEITYNGTTEYEIDEGRCVNNTKKITVTGYCVFTRTRYYDGSNPQGKEQNYKGTYNIAC